MTHWLTRGVPSATGWFHQDAGRNATGDPSSLRLSNFTTPPSAVTQLVEILLHPFQDLLCKRTIHEDLGNCLTLRIFEGTSIGNEIPAMQEGFIKWIPLITRQVKYWCLLEFDNVAFFRTVLTLCPGNHSTRSIISFSYSACKKFHANTF